MVDEEVQLGSAKKEDDYEVVPVGPMRKLERRMDELEQTAKNSESHPELIRDVLDIMKSNQKVVNDMTESTHQLKNNVEDLTHKMDEVIDNMNSFMDLMKEASEMDMEGEVVSDMEGRLAESIGDQMRDVTAQIQESNQMVAQTVQKMNENMTKLVESNEGVPGARPSRQRSGNGRSEGAVGSSSGQPVQNPQSNSSQTSGDERMKKLRQKFENSEG